MRKIVHRHLGKVVAGAAIAVAGTAVMVGITLPGTAGADDSGGTKGGQAAQQAAQANGAPAPGVVEQAPAEGEKGKGLDPLTDDETKRVEKIALNQQLLTSIPGSVRNPNIDNSRRISASVSHESPRAWTML